MRPAPLQVEMTTRWRAADEDVKHADGTHGLTDLHLVGPSDICMPHEMGSYESIYEASPNGKGGRKSNPKRVSILGQDATAASPPPPNRWWPRVVLVASTDLGMISAWDGEAGTQLGVMGMEGISPGVDDSSGDKVGGASLEGDTPPRARHSWSVPIRTSLEGGGGADGTEGGNVLGLLADELREFKAPAALPLVRVGGAEPAATGGEPDGVGVKYRAGGIAAFRHAVMTQHLLYSYLDGTTESARLAKQKRATFERQQKLVSRRSDLKEGASAPLPSAELNAASEPPVDASPLPPASPPPPPPATSAVKRPSPLSRGITAPSTPSGAASATPAAGRHDASEPSRAGFLSRLREAREGGGGDAAKGSPGAKSVSIALNASESDGALQAQPIGFMKASSLKSSPPKAPPPALNASPSLPAIPTGRRTGFAVTSKAGSPGGAAGASPTRSGFGAVLR